VDQYDHHQKEAFLKAFNNAYKEYSHDESRAFAVAHHAAKQAGKKESAA
jgi:cation transport regulator